MRYYKSHCPVCGILLSQTIYYHWVQYRCDTCGQYLYLEVGRGGAIINNLVEFYVNKECHIQFNSKDYKIRYYKDNELILIVPYFKFDWKNGNALLQRLEALLVFK